MPKRKAEAEAPPGSAAAEKSSCNQQLTAYIRSGKAGLFITSYEEARVQHEFVNIVAHLDSIKKPDDAPFNLCFWSVTKGIAYVTDDRDIPDTEEPMAMLDYFINKLPDRSILLARDFHAYMADANPILVRKLKDALLVGKKSSKVFVVCGCQLKLPPELEKEMAVVEFQLPDRANLLIVLEGIATSAGIPINGNTDAILDAASGLTTSEAEDAFALSLVECGDIKAEIVAREKSNTVKKNGILEILETKLKRADIAGSLNLIEWLTKRRLACSKEAKAYGLPIPKGVMAVGIPGTGKTLAGKIAASILQVPLIKLDAGRVFGSLVGQSEQNMRAVIQTAEAVAPCVLFIDEIEKAFSGSKSSGSTDGGTGSRVFGTFLSWLQDKTAPVFVFATANDISQLPPEFLRKGRFDELWFVDLPDAEERADIWRLHINKRGRNADKFNLEMLSSRTDGFTGAEIEAIVNEALFAAFDNDQAELTDDHLLDAVRNTVPLSRTMSAQIDALRAWATGRARRASAIKEPQKGARKLA